MSKGDNRFSKPVAFNKAKPVDQSILKHVSKRNFSGYVKKLILADMALKHPSSTSKETASEKMARLQAELTNQINGNTKHNANS